MNLNSEPGWFRIKKKWDERRIEIMGSCGNYFFYQYIRFPSLFLKQIQNLEIGF